MASVKSKLLSGIVAVDAEVEAHDMEDRQGGSFINKNGLYKTTIEKAFIHVTKSKGRVCTVLFRGANTVDIDLFIVSNKKGKLITTCVQQGKTVTLQAYKLFKQLMVVVTGELSLIDEVMVEEETIKYKKFGKDVKVKGEVITALTGKEIQIGITLKANYEWDKEEEAEDKTQYKTDNNGDIRYDKELDSVFNIGGFSAEEILTDAEEAKSIEAKKKYLESDKAIYHPKLEESEAKEDDVTTETTDDSDDELDF